MLKQTNNDFLEKTQVLGLYESWRSMLLAAPRHHCEMFAQIVE